VGTDRLNFNGGDPLGQSNRQFSCIRCVEIMQGLTSRADPRSTRTPKFLKSQRSEELKSWRDEVSKSRGMPCQIQRISTLGDLQSTRERITWSSKLLKSRSKSWLSINEETWRQIPHFRYETLQRIAWERIWKLANPKLPKWIWTIQSQRTRGGRSFTLAIFLWEISKHNIYKLLKPELPKWIWTIHI